MECLDQVNSNLVVPTDRASTASLSKCPVCDNYQNTRTNPNHTSNSIDNGNNSPTTHSMSMSVITAPQHTSSTVTTRSRNCSCTPSSPLSSITVPVQNTDKDKGSSSSPHGQKSLPLSSSTSSSPLSSKSPPFSSFSPSSSPSVAVKMTTSSDSITTLTTKTSHVDQTSDRLSLSPCNQSQTSQYTQPLSCHARLNNPSTTGSTHGLVCSPPSISSLFSREATTTDGQFHFDQQDFPTMSTDHNLMSPFTRDSNNSNLEDPLLVTSELSQTSSHHHHTHSKPITIQQKSSNSRSPRYRHHNDTDITEGCSLTPSAHSELFPSSTLGSMNAADPSSSRYNPFASSPAERLSLHFYSQQSPKYFKQPTHTSTSVKQATTGVVQGQGLETKPTVFDQWPLGLSNNNNTKSNQGNNVTRASTTKSLPKTNNRVLSGSGRRENIHSHRHRRSFGKSRWTSSDHDNEEDEDDVTMTPIEGSWSDPCAIGDRISADATPDRVLPQELLHQLHDLEHQNEDLSAEVIFGLEKKGFSIHEVLGKGISSTVRRVTEKNTGHEYAVKIIDISGEKGDADVVEQTKKDTMREIMILNMCGSHKNIIHLHDVFETPTFIFLVFELCRQGELFDYLTSVVSLSEKRTRIIMRQLLDSVQFIHENQIVHRDLKPENILMDDDLNIKVSDFGFATIVKKGEELGELCGTPGYLAPEVLAHSMYENVSGYGNEVDMWACGVIMYTLLCGAPPFWNRRQMMMLRAIMNADYTFNSPEWDDISEAPKSLIQKLLVVNPKERLTAREALAHPFFQSKLHEISKFKARRKFRGAVFCVMFYKRLASYYKHPPPISTETLCTNPYSIKLIRKAIDTCAFSMYRHWVKRVDNQNRAALFEHALRDEWKHNTVLVANNTKNSKPTPVRH